MMISRADLLAYLLESERQEMSSSPQSLSDDHFDATLAQRSDSGCTCSGDTGEQIVDLSVLQDAIEDYNKDQLSNTDARTEAVEKSISVLHERVTKEIETRQEQQSEVVILIANSAAATELLKLANNRLNGFYAPTLQHLQQHIVEEIIDVPVPEVTEQTVEVAKHIPRERMQSYTVEQFIDAPVSQIRKETGEVMQLIP